MPAVRQITPIVIIQQAAEKRELPLLIQDLDLHEICELPSKCLHVLIVVRIQAVGWKVYLISRRYPLEGRETFGGRTDGRA